MKTISCLIPLYRSERFLPFILKNIDAHLDLDSEVIVSDRHLLDDALKLIEKRYKGIASVICHASSDEGSWVDNINWLIQLTSGRYFHIVPHDDTVSTQSTRLLVDSLETNSNAILASGIVMAYTLDGNPLPEKNELNQTENPASTTWDLEDALSLFGKGRFGGAFKGVIRTESVKTKNLYIKMTASLVHSERAWLFGLALAGQFKFVPDSVYIKRYHDTSTHSGWIHSSTTIMDTARIMHDYCEDLIDDMVVRKQAQFNIMINAYRRAIWMENSSASAPEYLTGAATNILLYQNPVNMQTR